MLKKICSRCEREKDITAFRRDRARLDGRNSSCKVCMRAFQTKQYKEKYSKSGATRDKILRDENRRKLNEYKASKGCLYCSERETVCLEFHHTDMSQKDFTIASSTHRTWPYIEKEITKCIVVCSNCHKKVHAGIILCPCSSVGLERFATNEEVSGVRVPPRIPIMGR